jgi:hypothetical protein
VEINLKTDQKPPRILEVVEEEEADEGEEVEKTKRYLRAECKDRRLWNETIKQAKTQHGLQRRLKKKKK